MDREENIYRKNVHELDLPALAELCANVARNRSADTKQSDTAHALRVESVRLRLDRWRNGDKMEAEESLKKRMAEFLAEIPGWMLSGS
jgi:hypothetical protein